MSRRKQLNPKAIKVDENFVEESPIGEGMSLPMFMRDRRGEDSEDDRLFISEASHSPQETSSTFQEQNLEDVIINNNGNNIDSNNSCSNNNVSGILDVSAFYLDSIIKVEPGSLTPFTPIQNNNNNHNDNNFNNIQDGSFLGIHNLHKNSTSKSRRKSDRILPLPTGDGCDNFKCPVCGDILISNHELTKHIRSHNSPSEVTPTLNSCKICGKILSSMSSLDRHMLVHSGERPFQCRICNMAFTTNGNMHRHMRIHAKDQEVGDHGFFKDGVVYKPPKKKRFSENLLEVPSKKARVSYVVEGDIADEKHPHEVLQTSQMLSSEFYMRRPVRQSNEVVIEINPPKEKYFCTCCELSFYSLYGLMEHLSDHDSPFEGSKPDEAKLRYECLPCRCTFRVLDELESHLVEKHSQLAVGLKLRPFDGNVLSERLKADFLQRADESKRYEVDAFEITSEKFSLTSASKTFEIDNNNNDKNIFHLSNDGMQQQRGNNSSAGNGFDISAMSCESQGASPTSETSFADLGNARSATSVSSCPRCPGMSFLSLQERRLHELLCHVTEKIVGGWCLVDEREVSDPREDMDQREFMLILGLDSLSRKMIVRHQKGSKFKESLGNHRIVPTLVNMELGECKREIFDQNHQGMTMPTCTIASPNLQMFLSPSSEHQVTFRCPECPFTCGDSILLYRHERMHRTERFYKCLKCSQTFTTKANCERHLRKKHLVMTRDEMEKCSQLVRSSNPDDDPSSNSPRPAETVCKYCGEDFKMERALKHHLRSQSSCQHKPYTCQVCGTGFSTKANCLRHIQKQHSDLKPYESHMKVNLELIEAQKKVNRNHLNLGFDAELKKGDGGFDLLPTRPLQSLILGPAGRDNPKKQMPFESTSILDLRQMTTDEVETSSDEPLDFSFKKEELRIFPKPELRPKTDSPVDLSLKKPSTPKQAFLSGNSFFTACSGKHFPHKTSYVNLKSILKPFQASASPHNSSPKEDLKHFNPRTNRFHCPLCGAIFKHSEKLQSHLLTHNLAPPSSDVALSTPPPLLSSSSSSSSSLPSSSPYVQSSITRKTEPNSADFEQGMKIIINNNSPSCKNANTSNDAHHQNNLLSIPLSSLSSPFHPPSSSSFPIARIMSDLIMGAPAAVGSTGGKVGLNDRRFRLSASSFSQRLKMNMSNGRKNSYSDSPHKLKCHFCPRAFPWISSLKRHLLTHTGHKPFKCVKCMVTFSTKSNRERHMMRKHGINIRDQSLGQMLDQCYNCHLCDSLPFASLDMLLEHHKEMHAHSGSVLDLPPPLVIEPQEEDAEEVNDSIQTTNTSNNDEVELPQGPSTSLMLCSDTNTLLNILAAKAKSTPIILGRSNLASKNSQHVNPERDNYNVDKITSCWKCDLTFECRKGLLRHLKEHNVDLPYKCYLCDASYDTRMDSLQHKMSAHPRDWLSIKEKNKVSDDVLKYSDFMDKIVEETLAGNLQGRRIMTSSQDGLDLDLRPETDYAQRKVFCTLCPKRFWSLQDLRRHMRSHTGERPFECDVCQARFTLKHSMMRHRRKHQSQNIENINFYSNLPNNNNNNSNNEMATNNDYNLVDYDDMEEDEGDSFMGSNRYEAENSMEANCNDESNLEGAVSNAEDRAHEFMDDDDDDDHCDDEDENYELVIDEDAHHQIGMDEIIPGEA